MHTETNKMFLNEFLKNKTKQNKNKNKTNKPPLDRDVRNDQMVQLIRLLPLYLKIYRVAFYLIGQSCLRIRTETSECE